jgi:hypothetical protein
LVLKEKIAFVNEYAHIMVLESRDDVLELICGRQIEGLFEFLNESCKGEAFREVDVNNAIFEVVPLKAKMTHISNDLAFTYPRMSCHIDKFIGLD